MSSLPIFVQRLHGLWTSHAKCAFLHGPHAADTLALAPVFLTVGARLLGPDRDSPGDIVPLDEDASPAGRAVMYDCSCESCEPAYDPGAVMCGVAE